MTEVARPPAAPSLPNEAAPEEAASPQPLAVRLVRDHGYREERFNRGVFHWSAGEVITNPDEIAHLMERGADLEHL